MVFDPPRRTTDSKSTSQGPVVGCRRLLFVRSEGPSIPTWTVRPVPSPVFLVRKIGLDVHPHPLHSHLSEKVRCKSFPVLGSVPSRRSTQLRCSSSSICSSVCRPPDVRRLVPQSSFQTHVPWVPLVPGFCLSSCRGTHGLTCLVLWGRSISVSGPTEDLPIFT